jgi:hypothetical protein
MLYWTVVVISSFLGGLFSSKIYDWLFGSEYHRGYVAGRKESEPLAGCIVVYPKRDDPFAADRIKFKSANMNPNPAPDRVTPIVQVKP